MPLSGDIAELGLVEVVQLINLTRKAGVLAVETEQGPAVLYFAGGEVVHAQDAEGQGVPAVRRILACPVGRFQFEQKPFVAPRTVAADTLSLIMQAQPQTAQAPAAPTGQPPQQPAAESRRPAATTMLETGSERRVAQRLRPEQQGHPLLRFSPEQVELVISKLESL